jgi:tetratricopeptide (TPR) repeat protein
VEISRTLDARGPDHPATLEAVNNLAGLRYQQDRVSEAVELFRELHGACRRVLTPEDVLTLKVGNNLARCLTRLDQLEDARAILEVVVAQADEILPTDDFNAALFHGNYGECLARLGKCHDAEPHLTASYKAIKKRVGAAHDATRKAIQRLAEFHEKCGPVEKARAFRDLLAASSNSESQK